MSDTQVTVMESNLVELSPATQTRAVANLLQTAVERGMDPTALEKLVALHERIMDRQAEAEFNAAMKAFQSACPVIGKTSMADTGKYKYFYASLDHVADAIRPYCDKFGFCYSFDSCIEENRVKVTCTVAHIGGHKRDKSFSAPIDTRAAMNDTQKYASAVSYGQRYALKLAFGLSFGDDDDAAGKPEYPNPGQHPEAPAAKPRNERAQQKERPDESPVTRDEFGEFAAAWKSEHGEDKPGFIKWCHETIGDDFGASDVKRWTWGRLKEVRRQLDAERGLVGGVPPGQIPF